MQKLAYVAVLQRVEVDRPSVCPQRPWCEEVVALLPPLHLPDSNSDLYFPGLNNARGPPGREDVLSLGLVLRHDLVDAEVLQLLQGLLLGLD